MMMMVMMMMMMMMDRNDDGVGGRVEGCENDDGNFKRKIRTKVNIIFIIRLNLENQSFFIHLLLIGKSRAYGPT